jgi:hypothetical protein
MPALQHHPPLLPQGLMICDADGKELYSKALDEGAALDCIQFAEQQGMCCASCSRHTCFMHWAVCRARVASQLSLYGTIATAAVRCHATHPSRLPAMPPACLMLTTRLQRTDPALARSLSLLMPSTQNCALSTYAHAAYCIVLLCRTDAEYCTNGALTTP